jgi:ABC-type transport system involved in multi-copper enzyme maturation permease subunit
MSIINLPLVGYVLRAAIKDRLILAALALTVLTVSLSLFVGDAAIVEKQQFVLVYAAGSLRALTILTIVLFTAFFIQRSFAQRDVEYLLSRPLTRIQFLLSHAVGSVVIAALLAGVATLALGVLTLHELQPYFLLWGFSLFCEIVLMGLVALFFGMVLTSATTSILSALAFYILARMTGQLLGIVQENGVSWGGEILVPVTKLISLIMPRFDLMTQSSWLIYGPQGIEGILFILAQSSVFALLVVSAAAVDLVRRQF